MVVPRSPWQVDDIISVSMTSAEDRTASVGSWCASTSNGKGATLQTAVTRDRTSVDDKLLERQRDCAVESDVIAESSRLVVPRKTVTLVNETGVNLWLENINLEKMSRDTDTEELSCEPFYEGLDRSEINSSFSFAMHSVSPFRASLLPQHTEMTTKAAMSDGVANNNLSQPDAYECFRGVPVSATSPLLVHCCGSETPVTPMTLSEEQPTDISAMMTLYDVSGNDDISLARPRAVPPHATEEVCLLSKELESVEASGPTSSILHLQPWVEVTFERDKDAVSLATSTLMEKT